MNDGSWMVEAALPAAGYDLTGIFRSPGWKISCHRSFNHNQTAKEDGRGPEFSGFAPIPGQFQKPLEFPELKLGGKGRFRPDDEVFRAGVPDCGFSGGGTAYDGRRRESRLRAEPERRV